MKPISRGNFRLAGAAAPAPVGFQYSDVPNQILRINSLEGSLGFSGGTLTSVIDKSPSAQTMVVVSTPIYTAANAVVNGAPTFSIGATTARRVKATTLDKSKIKYLVAVYSQDSTTGGYLTDGTAGDRPYCAHDARVGFNYMEIPPKNFSFSAIAGSADAGFKMFSMPTNNTAQARFNGNNVGVTTGFTTTGTDLTLGSSQTGASGQSSYAFFMICDAVPSAKVRAQLEIKLRQDFLGEVFSYSSVVPNQIFRVNGAEGSFGFSGGTLTSVTDKSPSPKTITVTGSPTYISSSAGMGGQPAFTIQNDAYRVKLSSVARNTVKFCASVALEKVDACYTMDYDAALGVPTPSNCRFTSFTWAYYAGASGAITIPAALRVGEKRIILGAADGSVGSRCNGGNISGTAVNNVATGTGWLLGQGFNGTNNKSHFGFIMACSAVPSAAERDKLELMLIADFG